MTAGTIGNHHQICAAIVLSAVLLLTPHGTSGRPDTGRYRIARQDMPPQLLMSDLLANSNEDILYNELKKYHRQQPNYLYKWPGLRDLLLTADYDENALQSEEIKNSRFVERLQQLAAESAVGVVDEVRDENSYNDADDATMPEAAEQLPVAAALRSNMLSTAAATAPRAAFKDHGIKKNVQFRKHYMSPCHFKICNMGRKRNVRNFSNSNYY